MITARQPVPVAAICSKTTMVTLCLSSHMLCACTGCRVGCRALSNLCLHKSHRDGMHRVGHLRISINLQKPQHHREQTSSKPIIP